VEDVIELVDHWTFAEPIRSYSRLSSQGEADLRRVQVKQIQFRFTWQNARLSSFRVGGSLRLGSDFRRLAHVHR